MFLAINALTLIVLLRRRYYRLFPWFMLAMASTTWQAGVRLWLGSSSSMLRYVWTPGEVILMLAITCAICEAVWKSVEQMRERWRNLMYGGFLSIAVGVAWWVMPPLSHEWYRAFIQYRSAVFVGLAVFAFAGFWCGLMANALWPRAARMHITLYTLLVFGHALLTDWLRWGNSNLQYRALEMVCCGGWLINSGFLQQERESCQLILHAYFVQRADHHPRTVSYHPPIGAGRGSSAQVH